MSNEVTLARASLARLWANGSQPTVEEEAAARQELTLAKLRRDIAAARSVLTVGQRRALADELLS